MKNEKNPSTLYFIVAALFYGVSAISFANGNQTSMAVVWLCLGSLFLCLGSSQANKER